MKIHKCCGKKPFFGEIGCYEYESWIIFCRECHKQVNMFEIPQDLGKTAEKTIKKWNNLFKKRGINEI